MLITVSVFCLLAPGCSTDSDNKTPPLEAEIIDGFDVAVVGVGSSGHTAMLAAQEAGAKVIAIEQMAVTNAMMSAGIGAAESTQQKMAAGYDPYQPIEGQTPNMESPYYNPLFTWFTKDDLFNTLIEYSHYTANGPLVRRIVDESGPNIDWLGSKGDMAFLIVGSDQGMHFNEKYLQTYHMHFGLASTDNRFLHLVDDDTDLSTPPVLDSSQYPGEIAGTFRFNTRVIDLIMDTNGKTVIGVLAEDTIDHHPVKIYAKKVILTTGGYGPKTEKFKELLELENLDINAYGGEGNTGSGIEMAVKTAGAKLWGDHSFMLHNNVVRTVDGEESNEMASSPLFFLYNWEAIPAVNTTGYRFMNEKLVSNSALWANASYSQGGTYFILFSKNILEDLEANGIDQNMWYIGSISHFSFGPPQTENPPTFEKPTQAQIDSAFSMGLFADLFSVTSGFPVPKNRFDGSVLDLSITEAADHFAELGYLYKGTGATPEEAVTSLANVAGIRPAVLIATIEKYNEAVQSALDDSSHDDDFTGFDQEFGKQKKYLQKKLEGNTYYLMRMTLTSLGGSSGGIMVDRNLQVLDETYHPIPGLYAAGLNAGGFYGPVSTYYDYEGSAMMFATNSGRIAGEEAVKAIEAGD
jgi:fumarate reductase flavoprotein subunit